MIFTGKQVNAAVRHLIETDGLILPYGIWPDQTRSVKQVAQVEWDDYEWNPPQHWKTAKRYSIADADASPKPTSVEMATALGLESLNKLRRDCLNLANSESTRRIAINYHPDAGNDRHKEWETRLSGLDLATKDTERVRLIAVCHTIEASINAATTTAQLEAIDITSDSVWSADDD